MRRLSWILELELEFLEAEAVVVTRVRMASRRASRK
jgi:hypothetical protein